MEIVSALQLALADKVGPERFDLWFGAGTTLDLEDGALTVITPSAFFQDWLRANFRQHIEAACAETLGQPLPVRFRVKETPPGTPRTVTPTITPSPKDAGSRPSLGEPRLAVDTIKPVQAPRPMNQLAERPGAVDDGRPGRGRRFLELDAFVVGQTNRVAHAAALSVADRPGTSSPLVLYGPTSVGKTHLLEGIWTAVRRAHPRFQAVYLSAEQFTSLFLGALHGSGLPSFRRKYRGLDLLLIDDVQFFAGKRATLTEALHTIDTLLREGRQLVLSADRPPSQLGELGPELVTRLQSGLVCGLQPPEFDTRLGIVRQMASDRGLSVPDDVQSYIATHLLSHARELSGALNRLHATSLALGRPISLDLAEEALIETIRHHARSVRLADIEQAVCDVFGLEPRSLQSNRKGKSVSHPRMLAMWLARKHTRAALSEIGHHFGRRSHSTVISAQKKVNAWMAANSSLGLADRPWNVEDAVRRVEEALLSFRQSA